MEGRRGTWTSKPGDWRELVIFEYVFGICQPPWMRTRVGLIAAIIVVLDLRVFAYLN